MDTEIEDFRALQYDAHENQFRLCRLKLEPLRDEEVLVRVAYAGLCDTDFLIITNEFPCRLRPIVLGHEISGTVYKMGHLVKNIALGDRVVINPRSDSFCCTRCKPECVCVGRRISLGMYMDGGFAEYCLVPSYMIHPIPRHTILKEAVLCSTLCDVLHAWKQVSPVPLSEKILVTGAGLHGLLMATILHSEGYRNVTVSEPNKERRTAVSKLAPDFRAITPVQLLKLKNNAIWRPDLVLECSGNATAIVDALNCLNRDGRIVLHRCTFDDQKVRISPLQIISRQIKIFGSFTDPQSFPEVLDVLDVIGEKYINFEQWGIRLYELDDYEQAFLDLEEGTVTKAVFKVDKDLEERRLSRPVSETLSEVIRADLVQLLLPQAETPSKPALPRKSRDQVETPYEPHKTMADSFARNIIKSLLRRESFLPNINVPEEMQSLADKSFQTVRSSIEESKLEEAKMLSA